MGKPARQINYAEVEQISFESRSNSEICRRLGKNANYINQRSRTDPEFRTAIDAGKARRLKDSASDETGQSGDPSMGLKPDGDLVMSESTQRIWPGVEKALASGALDITAIAVSTGMQPRVAYLALGELVSAKKLTRLVLNGQPVWALPESRLDGLPIEDAAKEARQPNVSEIEAGILTAIRSNHVLAHQIKAFNNWSNSVQIRPHLEQMIDEGQIVDIESVGGLRGYFEPGRVPSLNERSLGRFVTNGRSCDIQWPVPVTAPKTGSPAPQPPGESVAPINQPQQVVTEAPEQTKEIPCETNAPAMAIAPRAAREASAIVLPNHSIDFEGGSLSINLALDPLRVSDEAFMFVFDLLKRVRNFDRQRSFAGGVGE